MRHPARRSLIAIIVSTAFIVQGAMAADWIGDFYTSAGAGVNITDPQAIASQNVIGQTGGGVSWRVPNKNFSVLQVTPPSLNAGCGGIDFYLGGYSFPNKAAFVNALRNFGQASVGYFFNLALKTMAPEIESTLASINKLATDINSFNRSNCAMAKQAVDTVAESLYNATSEDTAGGEVLGGGPPDYNAAKQDTQTDGYWTTVKKRYEQLTGKNKTNITKSEAVKAKLPERNVLRWAIEHSNAADLSDTEKDVIMSLVGPSLIVRSKPDSDGNGAPDDAAKGPTLTFKDLVGLDDPAALVPSTPLKILTCIDSIECLEVGESLVVVDPFARRIEKAIQAIRNGVIAKTTPALTAQQSLAVKLSSVPIARAAAMAETGTMGGLVTSGMIGNLRDYAAMEAAANFVKYYVENAQKAIIESAAQSEGRFSNEIVRIEARITQIKADVREEQRAFYAQHGDPFKTIEQLQQIEKFMYSNLNTMLAANARFKNRN